MASSSLGSLGQKPCLAKVDNGSVHNCWLYDVSELYDDRAFGKAMALLPWPERCDKVESFAFLKDRCLCLGAGLLCAHALRAAGAQDLAMGYGPNDKPYLLNHPDIHFNLSHSESMVACAVSSEPVGIDIEHCQPYDKGVSRLCFAGDEIEWLGMQNDVDRAFVRLWTRKESYLKLLGCGLSKPANSFSAQPGTYPEDNIRFYEYYLSLYALCVCARKYITGGTSHAGAFALKEVPSFELMAMEEL